MNVVRTLRGSTALVTGGGRGFGREIALGLTFAGAAVGVIARTASELAETVRLVEESGGTAVAATADVSDRDAVAKAVASVRRALGPIDLLINNAGVNGPIAAFRDADPVGWWQTIEVNLGGAANCARLVLPDMMSKRHGRIINITSQAGVFRWPTVSAYSVSKAALVKFTENLASEVRRYGVRVLSFHPGILPIGLAAIGMQSSAPAGSPSAAIARWAAQQRFTDPARSTAYVVALASGRADGLSGRHLSVDDDLDGLNSRLDEVIRMDLHMLRTHGLTAAVPHV